MKNPFVYVADYAVAVRLMVAALWQRDLERYRSGRGRTVVMVPGVYESWQFMRPLAEALHAAGHPVHLLPELKRNVGPIAETARRAQDYLEVTDLRDVVVVAHSKGGLIAKHMMLIDDVESRIDRLVTLATPFGGSSRARFMPVAPIREFLPTQQTLIALAANAIANGRITSIFGTWDSHIPEGSTLDGAKNIEVPVPGHFRLLVHKDVIDLVVSEVRS
jgi:triacylglycerol lipase